MRKTTRPKLSTFLNNLNKVYKILQVKEPVAVFTQFSQGKESLLIPAMQLIPGSFDVKNKNLLLKYSLIFANALTPYTENENWYELYLALDSEDSPIYFNAANPKENSGYIGLNFYVVRTNLLSKAGKIINRYVNRATPKIVLPKKENVHKYRLTGCFWICTEKNIITLPKSTFLLNKNRKIQGEEFKDKLFTMPEDFIEILLAA